MEEPPTKAAKKSPRKSLLLVAVLLVLLVCASTASGYWFFMYRHATQKNPAHAGQRIVDELRRTVELPSETPVFSTVADKTKLTNPQLRDKVANGDMFLIYGKAKRLVIYRPSTSKLIDIMTIDSEHAAPAPAKP